MRKHGIMTLEAIAFQDKAFFEELTAAVAAVSAMEKPKRSDKEVSKFFASKEVNEIVAVIKKHTNISIKLDTKDYESGPAIYLPAFNKNHIFHGTSIRKDFEEELITDAKSILAKMKSTAAMGSVDMINNKVSGIFAEVEYKMLLPITLFFKENYAYQPIFFTSEEYAAVILHEVGHAFTTLEFMDRTLTTNQVLAGISSALISKNPTTKEVVFSTAATMMTMSPTQKKAIDSVKTDKEAAVILLACAIDKSESELGKSIYDVASCEQLADQYSARCGTGRHMVIALDKLHSGDMKNPGGMASAMRAMLFFIITMMATHGFAIFIYLLLTLVISKDYDIYDNFHARIRRIKEQLIHRLKSENIENDERDSLVLEIEEIDKILATATDELDTYEKIAYYLKPSYRNAHKYELLQKELEQMASNALFVKAAKLETLLTK